ncbi:MBL fold metallo-hydrolase [Aneurinibacillus sp. Ricciae_BoGa-3]|uniref:MBL fold metallo-hydrolase n=1 Tax=Aneurinibacillus sp. Ricciae_BoGa-3 TaxID=3022697 RepID=UPI002340021E|nr:MBL fold metallo-hydrolase [Aneurinibacillus sp. Ricciae_BoGa-3]WCK56883.1 MBL fold metallo-hydrolase [Aneurinibacillus sp. Ricciae_BoGa-3]
MRVANGVEMLELEAEAFGGRSTLCPTLIWDNQMAILVDTGMPGGLEQIRSAMEKAGIPFGKLQAVILTHQDLDHIGGIEEVLEASEGSIQVYAHELDKPYIEGTLPLIKTTAARMAPVLNSLPEDERKTALQLCENPPHAKVDRTLTDGQLLPWCGGIRVLFTPGHTPGHISLYLEQSKVLVAADAMIVYGGVLRGPVQQTTVDMETALRSLGKFTELDIESVICYHGGFYNHNVKERLQELAPQGL